LIRSWLLLEEIAGLLVGIAAATALAEALNDERIFSFIIPAKRGGCEEMNIPQDRIDADPWCSQISVLVGDHP